MNKQKRNTIANEIRYGYFVIISLFSIMSICILVSLLYFNSQYARIQNCMIQTNRITELVNSDYDKLRGFSTSAEVGSLEAKEAAGYDNKQILNDIAQSISFVGENLPSEDVGARIAFDRVKAATDKYMDASSKMMFALKSEKSVERQSAKDYFSTAYNVRLELVSYISMLNNSQYQNTAVMMNNINTQSVIMIVAALILFIVIIVIAVMFSVRLSKSISKSLDILTKSARVLGGGDFSEPDVIIDTHEELQVLSEAFTAMKENIKGIYKKIIESSFVIYSSSNELKQGMNTLYESNNQVALSISDIAVHAESQAINLVQYSKMVEETWTACVSLQNSIKRIKASEELSVSKLDAIHKEAEAISASVSKIHNVGGKLSELSITFAANSEEISASTEEQLNIYKALLDTARKLDASAEDLDTVIHNLKTT